MPGLSAGAGVCASTGSTATTTAPKHLKGTHRGKAPNHQLGAPRRRSIPFTLGQAKLGQFKSTLYSVSHKDKPIDHFSYRKGDLLTVGLVKVSLNTSREISSSCWTLQQGGQSSLVQGHGARAEPTRRLRLLRPSRLRVPGHFTALFFPRGDASRSPTGLFLLRGREGHQSGWDTAMWLGCCLMQRRAGRPPKHGTSAPLHEQI